MRTAATVFILAGLVAAPGAAQDRSRAQGIPPGHLPPPTSCREAERIAARDRYARVIYGEARDGRDDRWRDRAGHDGYARDRYPYPDSSRYGYPYPNRDPYAVDRGRSVYRSVPFENGYNDGYDKGRKDAGDRHAYDPVRQKRYRSADHGYDRHYGSKQQYQNVYRDGFRAGYDEGYRSRAGFRREP